MYMYICIQIIYIIYIYTLFIICIYTPLSSIDAPSTLNSGRVLFRECLLVNNVPYVGVRILVTAHYVVAPNSSSLMIILYMGN